MRLVVLACAVVSVLTAATTACVEVPDSVRAQFAEPSVAERTNFRPGRHGSAPPVEDPAPAVAKAAATTTGATLDRADAGSSSPTATETIAPAATAADGGGAP